MQPELGEEGGNAFLLMQSVQGDRQPDERNASLADNWKHLLGSSRKPGSPSPAQRTLWTNIPCSTKRSRGPPTILVKTQDKCAQEQYNFVDRQNRVTEKAHMIPLLPKGQGTLEEVLKIISGACKISCICLTWCHPYLKSVWSTAIHRYVELINGLSEELGWTTDDRLVKSHRPQ